jgi:uncharacterized protein
MGSKYKRILAIDGGGIRGIIPGQILVAVEKKIQEKSGNREARIADYFDLISGTSTGGIMTCALLCPDEAIPTRPRYSASKVVDLYRNNGSTIFSSDIFHKIMSLDGVLDERYPSAGIESVLMKYFGDVRLKQLIKPCLITSFDIKRNKGHFFYSHKAQKNDAWDFSLLEVARATSAAPTYFEVALDSSRTGVTYPLIDGGVFVNNPALCAFSEARLLFQRPDSQLPVTAKDMQIFSLGTGYSAESLEYERAKDWGAVQWIKPLISIMMSGVSQTVDFQLRQIFEAATVDSEKDSEVSGQYIRIDGLLPNDVDAAMDCATDENMNALASFGTELAQNHDDDLNRLVDALLQEI